MEKGSKVAIVCCSNGRKQSDREKLELLKNTLLQIGLVPVFGDYIYEKASVFSGTGKERAESLMEFYRDKEIQAIFDISGGDIANELLPYLDFHTIAESHKMFWGYSDLTTIINAIYARTGKKSVLYQIQNLISAVNEQDECAGASTKQQTRGSKALSQTEDFISTVFEGTDSLFSFEYEFIQGDQVQGIVVGGNIRCLLKLAGTEYWPDMREKVLLLEGLHGTAPQMTTYLNQLQQIGVFEKVNGIILGTFTEMEEKNCQPTMTDLVKKYAGNKLPILKTWEIGHGSNSKGIVIGQEFRAER